MRVVTKASRNPLPDWEGQGLGMFNKLAFYVRMYTLVPEDVFNFDKTAVLLTPSADSGKARFVKGAKDVVVKSHGDKRQITCVPVISAAGEKLPLQLIFKGKDGQTVSLDS